jgi:hypothetical protein
MQVCERILTKCSSSSSPGKALLPAVLGVVDHQLGNFLPAASLHISSPCKTDPAMAHPTAMLMSPTKRPFCSSNSSPARTAMVISPSSASKAKRPLAVLQCCPNSNSVLSALQPHQASHHQAAGDENEQPGPRRAAKRLEVVQGFSGSSSSSNAHKPRQPVTPVISQPEPLAASLQTSTQRLPADIAYSAGAAAVAAAAAAAMSPAVAGVLLRSDDGPMFSQLPSPCTILEVPPALMAASSAGAAVQEGHADVEQLVKRAQHAPQHIAAHIMSGKKLDKRYDMPVNIGFLDEFSDHQPALGSGQLDVIMGPMFAGKTTALLKRVSLDLMSGLTRCSGVGPTAGMACCWQRRCRACSRCRVAAAADSALVAGGALPCAL